MLFVSRKGGFILITILMFFVLLTVIVAVYLFLSTIEMRQVVNNLDDAKALALAEAGIERGIRGIRDDVLTTTQIGIADLRGEDTDLSISIGTRDNMRYIDSAVATINANTDQAILRRFDSNYTNTRINSIELHARAARSGTGTNPTMQVSYTVDGVNYTTAITQLLTSTTLTDFSANITGTLSWQTIMSANFRLRTMRTAGTRTINLDSMYLRVTYEIDTNTESWATGGFATFPINLGDGTIESINITAEQGKVHLNTASQPLLRYLMFERGVPGATANTLARRIVNYRASKFFDSVEELKQINGMTQVYYDLIKDYVSVYSFINTYATRLTGNRAPININTASREVLEAIFDPLNLAASDPASLATDIINTRASNPFTCFYSSDSAITTDFYDFIINRAYLTAAQRNRVLDNADASQLVPVSGYAGFNAATTEFSYDTNSFLIDAVGKKSDSSRRVKTIIKDDGNKYLDTFIGDTTLTKYWREIAQ
ncbi:MAG: helix-hairpin-helix domain-containing protein [Candidatus Omnitrophota bacterium]